MENSNPVPEVTKVSLDLLRWEKKNYNQKPCPLRKTYCLEAILNFFENGVGNIGGSYQPILMILNIKQWKTTFYLVLYFEEKIEQKLRPESVPSKKGKIAAITSSTLKFQNPRKNDITNICQIICKKKSSKSIHPFGL